MRKTLSMHNNKVLIDGVMVKEISVYVDDRGIVAEIVRADDPIYAGRFGQVYYATCNPGVVKAWHYHKIHTDVLYCIYGSAKLCLFDNREGSPTRGQTNIFILNEFNQEAVRIPPGVLHGQICLGSVPCIVLNVQSHLYDPADEFKIDPFDERFGGRDLWVVKSC
jgi:dTDP-4-dehydrorhamnose 3,5-epimerase